VKQAGHGEDGIVIRVIRGKTGHSELMGLCVLIINIELMGLIIQGDGMGPRYKHSRSASTLQIRYSIQIPSNKINGIAHGGGGFGDVTGVSGLMPRVARG